MVAPVKLVKMQQLQSVVAVVMVLNPQLLELLLITLAAAALLELTATAQVGKEGEAQDQEEVVLYQAQTDLGAAAELAATHPAYLAPAAPASSS